MNAPETTLDDIADSITLLGTSMSELIMSEVGTLRTEMKQGFKEIWVEIHAIRSEIHEIRLDITRIDARLLAVENEIQALRADIKEIYGQIATLKKQLSHFAKIEYPTLRREVRELTQWARAVSERTGIPLPKNLQ